jgi:phenylalanyl-tRNA synthetase beta chain
MKISYAWLQGYIKGKLPRPEKLAELLTMHSFEVEEVKKTGKDFVLDVDVLPNRACDCLSHLGIARECTVLTALNFQPPIFKLKEDKNLKAKDFVSIEVKNKIACPRYTARVIADVKVGPSPKWLRDRLRVCGLNSINNIVDITNYVMLETGQPLHVFDGEKLTGKKIIVRFSREREKIVTLDEEKYDLSENVLVIADAEKPVAIAGIKGGKIPEINKKTKIIVIESANFNPRTIRLASKKINLKTDASWRFENSIDPNLTEFAVDRTASLIKKIAGGKVAQGLIDLYPKKLLPKKIKLDLEYLESLLGIKIPVREIKDSLKKLGFQISGVQPRKITVKVPTRRLDVSIPEDLIEEIGRIYSYQKIPSTFPVASLIPPKRNLEIFWEDNIKNILKESGFTEVYNYSFVSDKDAKIFGWHPQALIEIENPISIEQKYLRPSLAPNLLKNVQRNQKSFKEIRIFELGKVFINGQQAKNKKQLEKRMLTCVISGEAFYQLKGVTDLLLRKLGISNIWYDSWQPSPEQTKITIWHPKKCAEIKVDHQTIGFLGEIRPKILEDYKIENKVVIFDIDFEKLRKLCSEEHEYQPISPYPAAVRDIAVLVPEGVKVVEVLNKINAAGGKIIRDVDLFDIYEGEEISRGKKNLAFHIIYQAEDRTLSSKEIDNIQQRITKALEAEPEWQVRK